MIEDAARRCWICGNPADSHEHKFKRTDLIARFGSSWAPESWPFLLKGDGRPHRIRGPDSRKNLYENVLCQKCNNSRTQPYDRAYEEFSRWVLSRRESLWYDNELDFTVIFRNNHKGHTINLLLYFAKSLGCKLVAAGYEPPTKLCDLLRADVIDDVSPLALTFTLNKSFWRLDPTGRIIGHGDLCVWPETEQYLWSHTLGYLDIHLWYDVVYDPTPFGAEAISATSRAVNLGRYATLPASGALDRD